MSYQSDFEMLHAKWPAAVSTYCYEIPCLNCQGRGCYYSFLPYGHFLSLSKKRSLIACSFPRC
jgi:hypothetical protein